MLMPKQKFGKIDLEFLIIDDLCLDKIIPLSTKVNLAQATDNIIVRLSFYENSLDTTSCPVIYSAEKEITLT